MSGGSWDYAFTQINSLVEALERDTTTRYYTLTLTDEQKAARRRLAALLERVSEAMHAIEWVDSSDTETPSDVKAIAKVFAALPAPLPASEVPIQTHVNVLTDTVVKVLNQVESMRADVAALKQAPQQKRRRDAAPPAPPPSPPPSPYRTAPKNGPVDAQGYTTVPGKSLDIKHYAKPGASHTVCGKQISASFGETPTKKPIVEIERKMCQSCIRMRMHELEIEQEAQEYQKRQDELFVIYDPLEDNYLSWVSPDGRWLQVSKTLSGAARYRTRETAQAAVDKLVEVARALGSERVAKETSDMIVERVAESKNRKRRPPAPTPAQTPAPTTKKKGTKP